MKILQVHNYYQYVGGEDTVLKNEHELLISKNHTVLQYLKNNSEIDDYSLIQKGKLFFDTSYSQKSYREIFELLKAEKPDVVHVHNTLPLVTPAVYYACNDAEIPVVLTLHNYRLLCSNAYFFRAGKVCEECLGKSLYHSVQYGCYRNSKFQTFALARSIEKNKKWGTWQNIIDKYIALSEFSQNKFMEGGLPKEKLIVKPNFISIDPGFDYNTQNHFLFAGRLDVTKGIEVILELDNKVNQSTQILIAGEGPLKDKVISIFHKNYLGQLNHAELIKQIKGGIALIFPSQLYENMPLVIIESFSCGKPVIGSNLGAMAELIEDSKTGLLFEPGNAEDLAAKINWANEHREEMKQMGINARKEYEEKYIAEKNYKMLMSIYQQAIENRKNRDAN